MITRYRRIEIARYVTFFVVYIFLVSCSTLDPSISPKAGSSDAWLLRGKLGVKSEIGGGSLQIVWRQSPAGLDIRLMGPLGKAVAHIHGTTEKYRVDIPGQESFPLDTHAQEVEKALGWELPVLEMIYWVRGRPAPGIPHHTATGKTGMINRLEQSGWLVDYQKHVQGVPVRITFAKSSTEIKLVVKQWQHLDD
jgi:outer membrane lipoprotein LolB